MIAIICDQTSGVWYTCWEQKLSSNSFLMVHGLGGHSRRWQFLAEYLLQKKISSYAIELKGFGSTPELKGHIPSFQDYFSDIRALRNIIERKHPKGKIFLLGESLGGLLSFILSFYSPESFNGLICISPAFYSKLKFTVQDYLYFLTTVLVRPQAQLKVPFTAQMCTRDKAYQQVMDASDLEHRLASSRLLLQTLCAQIKAFLIAPKLLLPTLFLIAGNDALVAPQVSARIFQRLGTQDKQIIHYPEMFHALSIDLEREKVFDDICRWVLQRID